MTPIPDVVGNPLSRARELMGRAGVPITAVDTLDTPRDWTPRKGADDFQTEPYVVIQHPSETGDSVELIVVYAWLPPEQ